MFAIDTLVNGGRSLKKRTRIGDGAVLIGLKAERKRREEDTENMGEIEVKIVK